jgi:CBS domain-containing protein
MSQDPLLAWMPSLAEAIDRQPVIVSPTMLCAEAIALLDQTDKDQTDQSGAIRNDGLPSTQELSLPALGTPATRSSCLLVVVDNKPLGILTERDIVRLVTQSIDWHTKTVAEVMTSPVIVLPYRASDDIFAAIFLFRRHRIRHMPVVDQQEHLLGVVSQNSIRQILRPANLLRSRRVRDVMTAEAIHVPVSAFLSQIVQLMMTHKVSCIIITDWAKDQNQHPVGILTERDIVRLQVAQVDFESTQVQTVMSSPLFLITPEDSLWDAYNLMQQQQVGRLVVSWNWGQGLGIVTQTNLLRVFDPIETHGVIESFQRTIKQLEAELEQSLQQLESQIEAEANLPVVEAAPNQSQRLQSQLSDIDQAMQQIDRAGMTVEQRSQLQVVAEKIAQLQQDL